MKCSARHSAVRPAWNVGKIVGQKVSLKLKEIWSIRVRLQLNGDRRQLALFDLAIDSKLRACDLVGLRVRDVAHGLHVGSRGCIIQRKTKRAVQFEITPQTGEAVAAWIHSQKLGLDDYLFSGGKRGSLHLSTRQYARIVKAWGHVPAPELQSSIVFSGQKRTLRPTSRGNARTNYIAPQGSCLGRERGPGFILQLRLELNFFDCLYRYLGDLRFSSFSRNPPCRGDSPETKLTHAMCTALASFARTTSLSPALGSLGRSSRGTGR